MQNNTFKLPQRTATLKFTDSDFKGAVVVARLDVPLSFFLELQEFVAHQETWKVLEPFGDQVLQSWNLVDEEDQPLPADSAGLKQVSYAFANLLIQSWTEAVASLPAPLAGPSANGRPSAAASDPTGGSLPNLGSSSAPN
ncbi:MAG: hypothetical protein ACE5Q6_21775 [Dehalococcoidia bacterium]